MVVVNRLPFSRSTKGPMKMIGAPIKLRQPSGPAVGLCCWHSQPAFTLPKLILLSLASLIVVVITLTSFTHIPQVHGANLAINNRSVEDWLVSDLRGTNIYKPLFINNHSNVQHDDVSHWPVNAYYWQAPEAYYQWKIYTYGGDLKFLVNHIVTRGDTSGKYLDEPDLVLEGGPREHRMKIGYRLPREEDILEGYDKNQTIKMPLTEPGWYYLVEQDNMETGTKHLKLGDVPVSRADFSLVLAGLDRSLIRAKYHADQVEGNLYDVNMRLANNRSRTIECDNNCSGLLLDDLDDIGLLFDEIRRLAPGLKDGPWRRLAWLNGRTNNLAELLSQYLKLIGLGKEVIENYSQNFDPETQADILDLRASNLDSRVPSIALEAYQTRLLAEKTLEDLLKGLWDKIRKTIKMLNENGFGPGGVSPGKIERIVKESEMILRELRNRNLRPHLDDAERELRRAKLLLDKIKTLLIDPNKSDELLKRLEQLEKVLVDFRRIVQDQVQKPVERANDLVAEGKKKYQMILALLKEAEERGKESQGSLDEARRMLEITKKCLADEAAYLDLLPRQLTDLNNSLHEIEIKRSILTQVNPDYQRKYVDKCRDHSEALLKKSQELDGLFNATRDVADYALRAANAYLEIAKAIADAEKAAKRALDAADKAYKVAVPDFDESLADKARESKRRSQELLERAKKLRDQELQRLTLELAKRKQLVDQLTEDLKNLASELDQINAGLKQLADKNYFEQLQEIDTFLKRLLERIAEIHKRLQLLSDIIYNNILPQYEQLSAGSQSSLGNLSQVLDLTRKDLMSAIKYASNSKISLEKLLKLEAKLDLDLDMLRRKIQLAHQEASSVHISVGPSSPESGGVCTRSYFVPALLSATRDSLQVGGFNLRQLSLIWSLHADEPESLLLFIGSKSGDEFLALEMYERHIRLVYSLNSQQQQSQQQQQQQPIQVLTHPKTIELNDKGLLSDDAWYLINVSVDSDAQQIRLSVKSVPRAQEPDKEQVSQRLLGLDAGGSSRLAVSPYGEADINFYVGGLPTDFSPPSQIKSSRLTGCLYDLVLNDQQLGLWNFKTNQGCEGCWEGPLGPRDTATFSFTGVQSYATVAQSRFNDRTRHMISLSVKTTDSDAVIFVALSESTNHYISLMLNKGRVVYLIGKLSTQQHTNYLGLFSSSSLFDAINAQLLSSNSTSTGPLAAHHTGYGGAGHQNGQQHSSEPPLEHMIVTNRDYNNGQWFKITAEKDQTKLVLVVEDEFKESIVDDKLLTLDVDQLFFGGLWPIIRPKKFANTSLEFSSMSGCVKDIQIETSPVDLVRRQSHGVETGCSMAQYARPRTMARSSSVAYPLPAGR
uniref:Laminin subunit alpha-2 n=1 Tax=Aceria tosichella TaxID=561515 RepID=A0A6G1SDG7_9ACAR